MKPLAATLSFVLLASCSAPRTPSPTASKVSPVPDSEITEVTAIGSEPVARIQGSTIFNANLVPHGLEKDSRRERELPFTIEFYANNQRARIWNGSERIEIPEVYLTADSMWLQFPHYDSQITARRNGGGAFDGEWIKHRGNLSATRMAFRAVEQEHPSRFDMSLKALTYEASYGGYPRKHRNPRSAAGRFQVTFSASEEPAVAILRPLHPDLTDEYAIADPLQATFLTTLGDYRFLAGDIDRFGELKLSCFDGAHAFLFHGNMVTEYDQRQIKDGHFWSSDTWHETWTAIEDTNAALPDAFDLTQWNENIQLANLRFPLSTDDRRTTPSSPISFVQEGEGLVLHLFGTWCPNCADAAADLARLAPEWLDNHSVRVVGLAFEHSDDPRVARERVRVHKEHHHVDFPVMVAGLSDKAKAAEAFPALDKVRAYPTTVFIDHAGVVRAVHTGWNGPATGAERERMLERFDELVASMAKR